MKGSYFRFSYQGGGEGESTTYSEDDGTFCCGRPLPVLHRRQSRRRHHRQLQRHQPLGYRPLPRRMPRKPPGKAAAFSASLHIQRASKVARKNNA